jgi:hypothetical protein
VHAMVIGDAVSMTPCHSFCSRTSTSPLPSCAVDAGVCPNPKSPPTSAFGPHFAFRSGSRCRFGFTRTTRLRIPVAPTENPQALPPCGSESRLVAGPRLDELMVEACHPTMVVSVRLSDLEESASSYLTTEAIELLQHAVHHPGPAFTRPTFLPEVDPGASRLIGGGAEQALDPFETPFDVEQVHLPSVIAFGHPGWSRT